MKTAIKLTAIAAAIACGAIASHASFAQPQTPAQPQVQREGVVTDQRQVGAFSAIELSGPWHVVITAQGRQAVALSGERKQLDGIETVVRGDTLVVRPVERNGFNFSFGFHKRRETPTITIVAPGLKSLKMSGSGDVELGQVGGERFTLASSGPGDLHANGAVRQLSVESSGSGDLDLRQLKAASADIDMHGPGDLRLAGSGNGSSSGSGSEPAAQLNIRMSGSGDLTAEGLQAGAARVRLSGPGDARLEGSIGDLNVELSGSGDLNGRNLKVRKAIVRSHGPGGVKLQNVSDTLDAELHGSGDLAANLSGKRLLLRIDGPGDARIDGSVAEVSARLSGSGSLEGRSLAAGSADIAVHGPGSAAVQVVGNGGAASERGRVLLVDRSGTRHVAN